MNQQSIITVIEAQRNYEFKTALKKIKEVSDKCGLDVRVLIGKKKNNEQQ